MIFISTEHAVVAAFPEMSEYLNLIFGLCPRSKKNFALISREFNLQQQNIVKFQITGGFETFQKLCQNQLPLSILIDFLDPIVSCLMYWKDSETRGMANNLLKEITPRFEKLSDQDIKDMQIYTICKLCNIYEYLFQIIDPSNNRDHVLGFIFNIGIQLLKSVYIQKKLLGIAVIKDMLPKNPKDRERILKAGLHSFEWQDPNLLIKLIEERKLIDLILGENANAEILKKVEDLFQFLMIFGKPDKKFIDSIWSCCNEKHEDITRSAFNLLISLVKKMPIQLMHDLFQNIEKMTPNSEIKIKFLEDYTTIAVKMQCQAKKIKIFNLDLFWNLLEDNQQIEGKVKDLAFSSLLRIMCSNGEYVEEYVLKSAENIKNGINVIRSIQYLKEINFAGYKVDNKPYYNLAELNKSFNLIQNTIEDCIKYHEIIKKNKIISADPMKTVIFYINFIRILEQGCHLKDKQRYI